MLEKFVQGSLYINRTMWILEFVAFDFDISILEFSKIKFNKFWNFRIRIQENQFLPNLEIQIFIIIYIEPRTE